jgi:hypothetical protein
MASASQERKMHVIGQGAAQGVESAKAAIVLVAIAVVAFWRVILRLLLALIAIAVVVLVGAGAEMFLHK